ncbi:MAG: glycosyltransferase family 4 protein [Dehalococcoidia bacterium]|nr:glycosyltransferase family 4 protein [Dehalococcoidia bacterium]
MRIAQIAPLWERVPPPLYGGTEAVVSLLTDELVRRGHDVVLYATGDSETTAELRTTYPLSLRSAEAQGLVKDTDVYEWVHVANALKDHAQFDVIHNHGGELPMALSSVVSTPMLTTLHGVITPDARFAWDSYPWFYNTISRSSKRRAPDRNYLGVVYNAVDVESYPYDEHKEEYLLFLGRISPEKGPVQAIEVAKRLGKKLIIAGKVDKADREYFHKVVEPLLDDDLIDFFGEANGQEKRELYRKAMALLMPLCWEEPFGLVMAEALACGTPVIAFPRGAAPEIILDGKTGYLVNDVEEMARAVHRLDRIDPKDCRRHVKDRFDVSVMADGYLALYERVLEKTGGKRNSNRDPLRWRRNGRDSKSSINPAPAVVQASEERTGKSSSRL